MTDKGPEPSPRELFIRYLGQLASDGETELPISRALAAAVAGAPTEGAVGPAPRGAVSPGPKGAVVRGVPPGAGGGTSDPVDGSPEPEVVECELALMTGSSQADIFGGASPIEACRTLEELSRLASECEKCELARTRTNVVFGVGDPSATLMFVGEAPGRDEDEQGIPFVGRAGKLLDEILSAAGIARGDVYIGNIIKCRPPGNRTPSTAEIEACIPYLAKQAELIRPKIICTLGLPATQALLGVRDSMGNLRGTVYRCSGIDVIPTYHPAAALRDPKYKRPLWDDFLLVRREYDRHRSGIS